MAVDLSPLEDNDWLVCTDTNGITYKVSFENIKGLLAPRTGMDITIDTEVQVPGNTFFSLLTGGEPSKLSPGGEVDWGDGSPPVSREKNVFPGTCTSVSIVMSIPVRGARRPLIFSKLTL
jgi:hypothetical protein